MSGDEWAQNLERARKANRFFTKGPHAGVLVPFESRAGIESFGEFCHEFLDRIFGFEEALVQDGSTLWQFTHSDRRHIFGMIHSLYGVDVSDIKNGNLVQVLSRLRGVTK